LVFAAIINTAHHLAPHAAHTECGEGHVLAINGKNSGSGFDCDVLVVGAGPEGATAAYYIALAGYKVTILDKQKFPRQKVSGDFVSPGSIRELRKIGVTSLPEFQATNVISQVAVYLNGEKLISGTFPQVSGLEQHGQIVSRKMLDSLILEAARKAGATVLEGFRVTDFRVENDGVTVTSQDLKGSHNLELAC
jgi:menaquinone-9 beta-reductase